MKWGLRIFGLLDAITFLIFISAKINFLLNTFNLSYSLSDKIGAIWEVLILLLFIITGILLLFKPQLGLSFSFLLIPFRIIFLYFSLDFLSFATYYLGYTEFISTAIFNQSWFYVLLTTEILRYTFSFYWYYKLKED